MPETDFGMPDVPQTLTCSACPRIWHARQAGDFGTQDMLGMNSLLEPRLLSALVRRSRNLKICLRACKFPLHANLNAKTTKHSGVSPSITSEQIIDNSHGKNPCMLTKIKNIAEMSSVAESCPRGGFKIQNFLTLMREFSLISQ